MASVHKYGAVVDNRGSFCLLVVFRIEISFNPFDENVNAFDMHFLNSVTDI